MRSRLVQIIVLVLVFGTSEGRAQNTETILVFRGLFAFDTTNGKVVFLDSENHPPRIMVRHQDFVEGKVPTLAADLVIPTMDGYGIGLWKFKSVRLATENLQNGSLAYDREKLDSNGVLIPVSGERTVGDNTLAWIPRMTTVAPLADRTQPRKMDDTVVNAAKSTGTFPVGKATPIFDDETSNTQCFTIGERKCTAVADGMELRVTIKNEIAEEDAVLFYVDAEGQALPVPFIVKPGARVELFALPRTRGTKHLEHFEHYFGLPEGDKTKKNVFKCTQCAATANPDLVAPPGTKPIRCAPVEFP